MCLSLLLQRPDRKILQLEADQRFALFRRSCTPRQPALAIRWAFKQVWLNSKALQWLRTSEVADGSLRSHGNLPWWTWSFPMHRFGRSLCAISQHDARYRWSKYDHRRNLPGRTYARRGSVPRMPCSVCDQQFSLVDSDYSRIRRLLALDFPGCHLVLQEDGWISNA